MFTWTKNWLAGKDQDIWICQLMQRLVLQITNTYIARILFGSLICDLLIGWFKLVVPKPFHKFTEGVTLSGDNYFRSLSYL